MFHKRLLNEFKDSKRVVIGIVISQWISLLSNILFLYESGKLIQDIVYHTVKEKAFVTYGITVLAVLVVRVLMTHIGGNLSYKASTLVKKRLRSKIYEKLLRLGGNYHEKVSTSEVVQVSTEGVEQLEIYFGRYLSQFFYSLLAPITLFVVVGTMSIKVATVLLACVPLIPVSIVVVQKIAKKMLNKYWGIYTGLGDTFLESLQGLVTLKIYNADECYAKKMDEESERFRKITMRVLIMQLNSISIMDFIAYGGAALGIILSFTDFRNHEINLWQCFFIIMVSAEFFLPLRQLGSYFHIAMNGNAAANKIFQILDLEEEKVGNIELFEETDIVIKNLSFSYANDEKKVLEHVSMVVKKNQFVALVGESGSGKSTIASLIVGDYLDQSDAIMMGKTKRKELSEQTVKKHITRVKHNSYLFKGTLRDNLLMGNETALEEDMFEALKKVQLYDFVMQNGGIGMHITEKAANLSGGQCQRLAIARAILHDSDIYIFDEATSNIDVESENIIMDMIKELVKTKTVLLISHRLTNVVGADVIYVMKNGKIVEEGTHKELMNRQEVYHTLYSKQKELENYHYIEEMGGCINA